MLCNWFIYLLLSAQVVKSDTLFLEKTEKKYKLGLRQLNGGRPNYIKKIIDLALISLVHLI